MLKKTERLNRALFLKYFKEGKKIHSDNVTVVHYPFDKFLAAVSVGKKVSKSAVDRNRLRRQVYGVLQKLKIQENPKGVFIVVVKPSARLLTRKEFLVAVEEEVGRIIK